MSLARRTGRTAIAVAVLAVALLFAACAPTTTEGGAVGPTETGTPEPEPDPDPTPTDGEEPDPDPELVRTGPTVNYGGPAYGDQGETQLVADGVWCETVALFWGGSQPIPEGVVMTFTEALVDADVLEVTENACGTDPGTGEPLPSCIGLELDANESAFCGLEVIPGALFADGTVITFGGTMTCPTAEDCATVETRDAEEGPEIVVDTPAGS
jgi:hypothetical protein